jgi:hypothetical protein
MKKLILAVIICSLPLIAFGETKEGTCELKQGSALDKDVLTVQVGDKIKGTAKFYITDFLGQKIISANIKFTNTANESMHCEYYVAFFDKDDRLVGCAHGGTGLAAGESTMFGSCLIPLPKGFHEKVVQYKIAFYEDDKPIGK